MTFTDPEVRVRSIPTASALVLAGYEPVRVQRDGVIVFAPSAMEAFEKFFGAMPPDTVMRLICCPPCSCCRTPRAIK